MSVTNELNQHRYKILSNIRHSLYHYSTLEAMMSIFEKKQLWLTQSKYLNDISEIRYARKIAKNVRDEAIIKYNDDPYFTKILESYNDEVFETGVESFILSMSMNADSLLLWSNYSNNDGYCIGFNANFINRLDKIDFQNVHGFVIYDPKEQSNILSDEISTAYNIWKNYGDGQHGNDYNLLWNHIHRTFYIYSLFFKDPCFSSEEEYRVVFLIK